MQGTLLVRSSNYFHWRLFEQEILCLAKRAGQKNMSEDDQVQILSVTLRWLVQRGTAIDTFKPRRQVLEIK